MVARTGDANFGPDLGPTVTFAQLSAPSTNSLGQLAFGGYVQGPGITASNDQGIWVRMGNITSAVIREGLVSPNLGSGINFTSFTFPVINNVGQITFAAFLSGPGVTSANNQGLWVWSAGELVKIARMGDLFDLAPSPSVTDLRVITGIDYWGGQSDIAGSSGEDGRRQYFNDQGALVFRLRFSDGSSGIFTALVPEPAAHALAITAAIFLARTISNRNRRTLG